MSKSDLLTSCNAVPILWLLWLLPLLTPSLLPLDAFMIQQEPQQFRTTTTTSSSLLHLAKSSSRNKQADLRQKLEEAKRQRTEINPEKPSSSSQSPLSYSDDNLVKQKNDRLRFEELLKRGGNVLNDYSTDGYLTKEQEEEEITASVSGIDRIFEGDPAPTDCFEELVSIKSGNAIGITGKQRLVPWLHKNTARHNDYAIIITEPRLKSSELYDTVKIVQEQLSNDVKNKMIIINADSPSENRRWLKKNGYDDEKVLVYSDEKRQFMRTYTALGTDRYYMTMFIISNGRVQKLARDINPYGIIRTVENAIKSLQEIRLS